MMSLLDRPITAASDDGVYCWHAASKGAGSGMAGMAAAIPIQNLVWRRHTNQKQSGELVYHL